MNWRRGSGGRWAGTVMAAEAARADTGGTAKTAALTRTTSLLALAAFAALAPLGAAHAAGPGAGKGKAAAGTCDVAFNPTSGRFIAIASRHDAYGPALAAARELRKKKLPAEIVPAEMFGGDKGGFLVLLGAKADRAQADALAAASPGASVREVSLPADLPGPMLKPAGVVTLPGVVWDVQGDVATVVEGRDIATFKLRDKGKPQPLKVVKDALRADAHLAVLKDGDLYILDEETFWWRRVGDEKIAGPVVSPDVEPPSQASVGPWRFTRKHGPPGARGLAVERAGKPAGFVHLGWLEPLDSGGPYAGLPFARGAAELDLAFGRDLHRFEVSAEPRPARLVKVCGRIDGAGATGKALKPVRIKLGAQDLASDDEGRFETWSPETGSIRLLFVPGPDGALGCAKGKTEYAPWNPSPAGRASDDPVDVDLFGDASVSVRVQARCGKE